MLNSFIDRFQAKFPPNRLVALAMALLLPTVIAPGAAYVAAWVPAHFPGLPAFSAAQLTAFALAGASTALLAGVTAGYKYIDGWQKDEEGVRKLERLGVEEAHRNRQQAYEVELALIKSADDPFNAKDAVDQYFGTAADEESPEAPEARVAPPPRAT